MMESVHVIHENIFTGISTRLSRKYIAESNFSVANTVPAYHFQYSSGWGAYMGYLKITDCD